MSYHSFVIINYFASITMKLMNSVVLVGLYYGFLTALSAGPSYLLLIQVRFRVIEEGEEAIEKEVAASTGFMVGQLLMFVSIFYRPLHLVLSRPDTITFITVPYLYLHYMRCSSREFFVDNEYTCKNSMRTSNLSIQCIFLNNLFFQLLNHFSFFPSTMFFRLLNVYMFRYNNKTLFLTSSFVGWLIGHILFMKSVIFVLVWIRQNYLVRSDKYIRSKKYLFHVFRFYQNLIFDLRNFFDKIGGIFVFFTCLLIFNKMPLPILTYKPKEAQVEIALEKVEEDFHKVGLAKKEEFTNDELYNYRIRTNEQKKNNLSAEFSNRIKGLDKKRLKKINVLEKKTRLGDKKKIKYTLFTKINKILKSILRKIGYYLKKIFSVVFVRVRKAFARVRKAFALVRKAFARVRKRMSRLFKIIKLSNKIRKFINRVNYFFFRKKKYLRHYVKEFSDLIKIIKLNNKIRKFINRVKKLINRVKKKLINYVKKLRNDVKKLINRVKKKLINDVKKLRNDVKKRKKKKNPF